MRQRVKGGQTITSATELEMRMGDWTWRNGRRGEDLQLALCFCDQIGVPVGSWGLRQSDEWGKGSLERKIWVAWPTGDGSAEKGEVVQVVCYFCLCFHF